MLHLIGFDDLDSATARDCLAVYGDGDLCDGDDDNPRASTFTASRTIAWHRPVNFEF